MGNEKAELVDQQAVEQTLETGRVEAQEGVDSGSDVNKENVIDDATLSSDDKKEKKEKEKKKKEPTVPLHKLFRFASKIDLLMILAASIGSIGVGVIMPASMIIFGDLLGSLGQTAQSTTATTNIDFLSMTLQMILIFVYMGTASLVASYVSHAFWVISGERQIQTIRRLYLHAIYRQDMSWFDAAEEGSLTTRLATDIQMVQEVYLFPQWYTIIFPLD